MMNVLHVIPYMHPSGGGPPVVVDRLCRGLSNFDVETKIVTTDLYARVDEEDKWLQHWTCAERIEVFPVLLRSTFAFSPALSQWLLRECGSFDLIHLHTLWSHASLSVNQAARKHHRPYLVMPHGMLDPHSMRRKRIKKWIYGKLIEFPTLRGSAGLVCTHEDEYRLANESCRGLPRSFVTPLGADELPADRETLRKEFFEKHSELEKRELVLFLSRLHEKKGLDLLLPAVKLLLERRNTAHLLLVGSGDATYESSLRELIQSLDLTDYVTMTGNLSGREKWQAMAASDLFALTSYQENFSLVTADAMRIGLPVVLSRRVNIWNEIVSAGAGCVCELDPVEIAQKLEEILQDPSAAQTMGQAGQRLIEEQFNWSRCTERTANAYRTILNR